MLLYGNEKQVEKLRAMIKAGQASQTDLGNLEEQLARIRAELARYRETASETAGAGLLPQLNKQLVELSVDSAKEEAVLAAVKTRLAEIRERRLLELSDRYEREVESQLELCERIVRELTVEQYELKARIRNLRRPEVVIIGDK